MVVCGHVTDDESCRPYSAMRAWRMARESERASERGREGEGEREREREREEEKKRERERERERERQKTRHMASCNTDYFR